MIRPIRQLGDVVLKIPARTIDAAELLDGSIADLVRDMTETLAEAGGVGLAAPQVGESLRVLLAGSFPSQADPDRPSIPIAAMINPRIISASEETEPGWEGCLSFPQWRVRVARSLSITVEYLALDGTPSIVEATGFYARVLQHELDHLDGLLTIDRASSLADITPTDPAPSLSEP